MTMVQETCIKNQQIVMLYILYIISDDHCNPISDYSRETCEMDDSPEELYSSSSDGIILQFLIDIHQINTCMYMYSVLFIMITTSNILTDYGR